LHKTDKPINLLTNRNTLLFGYSVVRLVGSRAEREVLRGCQ